MTTKQIKELDESYAKKIRERNEEPEERHVHDDDDLLALLFKLGCKETVAAYDAVETRWYS